MILGQMKSMCAIFSGKKNVSWQKYVFSTFKTDAAIFRCLASYIKYQSASRVSFKAAIMCSTTLQRDIYSRTCSASSDSGLRCTRSISYHFPHCAVKKDYTFTITFITDQQTSKDTAAQNHKVKVHLSGLKWLNLWELQQVQEVLTS